MKKIIVTIIASTVLVVACGSDDPTESALTSVCDAEVQVLEDLAALGTLDPAETSGEDLKGLVEDLSSSVESLDNARDELQEQDIDNVESAFESLRGELSDLDDVPLAELEDATTATIGEAITAFQAAYQEAYANSSCTPDAEE